MKVRINKRSAQPIEVVYDTIVTMHITVDEAERLISELKDAICEVEFEDAKDPVIKATEYIHGEGIGMHKAKIMAAEIHQIIFKNSPTINLDDYYRERREKEIREEMEHERRIRQVMDEVDRKSKLEQTKKEEI